MDHPPSPGESYACAKQKLALIKKLCDREEITLSSFFSVVWSIVLQSYTGSEVVALAVGGSLAPPESQLAILPDTKLVDLYRCANISKEILQDSYADGLPKYGLWITPSTDDSSVQDVLQSVELGLLVDFDFNDATVNLSLCYKDFAPESDYISLMASTILYVIDQMVTAPVNQAVKDLQLLNPKDFARIVKWNSQGHLPANQQSITCLIRQKSLQLPDHPAIDAWDGMLTYSQLEKLTTQIAIELQKREIGKDSLVPVCIEKSLWAVVAEISVLKAGGAFVPMDPSQPASWWKSTVQETQAKLVMTSAKQHKALLSAALGTQFLILSNETFPIAGISQHEEISPSSLIRLEDPTATAYVLFTSGSTSKPKGCIMERQALAEIARHNNSLSISSSSRVLQFASYTFAISLIEIYCTLTSGGTVCIPSDTDRMNNLLGYMNEAKINWALMTPSTANSLIGPSALPTLQSLFMAGEPMGQRHVDIWADGLSLHQCYGLSEWAGICAVSPRISAGEDLQLVGLVPTTSNIWLVDPSNHQKLAPIGAVAELLIEGPNITRGYLNNPEKTAAAILDSVCWLKGVRQSKIYKTGDLVQYLPNGSIRYIARKDTQAKVRGKRVELTEVEHAISVCCPSSNVRVVAEAVVPASGDGTSILAVFLYYRDLADNPRDERDGTMFVRTDQLVSDSMYLQDHMPQVLSDHMVPAVYIQLKFLPLTITGKIDRRALRLSTSILTRTQLESFSNTEGAVQLIQPTDPLQILLHKLFSTVLGIEADIFGIDHSFLRLGGDSIKAMRLAQACRPHGLALTVSHIMKAETVANLVSIVENLPTVSEDEHEEFPLDVDGLPEFDKVEEIYPCSPIQEGILLSQVQSPDQYQLRIVWVVQSKSLESPLNAYRLQEACNQLIDVHPMLRTVIIQGSGPDGSTLQATLPKSTTTNTNVLLQDAPDVSKLSSVRIAENSDRSLPQQGLPVLTIHKSREGNKCLLSLDVSHTLVDALSLSIIARDIECLYDGVNLASIPRATHSQYIRYIKKQSLISNETAVKYWHEYLADFTPCLLQFLPGQELATGQWRSMPICLGDPAQCHRFSKTTGITVATVFKLAWSLVLRSFAATNDVCFGYMTSSRDVPLPGIESAVGPFLNMAICRVQIDVQSTLLSSLQKVQSDFIDSLAHQNVSLLDVRASLGLMHSDRIFNTSMTFPPELEKSGHSSIKVLQADLHDPTEFDVMVEVRSESGGVFATLKHWTHLVPKEEAERLARTLGVAIDYIIKTPKRAIAETQVLDTDDLDIMARRNKSLPGPSQLSVHDLIEYQTLNRPTADAVCSWDGDFSFQELGDYSTRLAQYLVSLGVGPEVFVPLCLSRSRWTPVAILAVIKAGGAFVLLDASYPVQRLRDIIDQLSHPGFVITLPEHANVATQLTSAVHLVGDVASDGWPKVDLQFALPRVQPSTALYAVFTSGSTGKPKGIVVEHGSYSQNALIHMQHIRPMHPRVLQFSGYSFDVSIFEHLTILISGGCLCIPSEHDRLNRLAQVANEMKVNSMYLTPSVSRTILPSDIPNVKRLGFVGEAMNQQDIKTWSPYVRITNWYGPAECTVFCGIQPSMGGLDARNIGWPEGCAFWVTHTDDPNQLLPVGAVGELLVQGPVVSRGYINNPEKNAAAFIEPPTWISLFPENTPVKGAHFYRTGDLVQVTKNDSYLYLGRKDTQIKLRGHRLEVTEVEHHIRSSFGGATDVVAEIFKPEGIKSEPVLVAFVGCQAPRADELSTRLLGPWNDVGFKLKVAATRAHLEAKLPSYMVPNIFFPLAEVPISRSGKTERLRLRQALMALSSSELNLYSQTQTVKIQPSSKLEFVMQRLFAQILNVELDHIGADDNFFRLRGDSIAAMKLVAAARQEKLGLSVADVFNYPVLCDLAKAAHQLTKEESEVTSTKGYITNHVPPFSLLSKDHHRQEKVWQQALSMCELEKYEVEDLYPTTSLQEGLMALTAQQGGMYTVQLILSVPRDVDTGRLKASWQRVVDLNPILRTRIVPTENDGSMQVVVKSESVSWTIIPDDGVSSLEKYLDHDLADPMSFGQRLIRFALLTSSSNVSQKTMCRESASSSGSQKVVLTMHHAIHDRWSISHLLQQVDDAYRGLELKYRHFNPFIHYIVNQDQELVKKFWISEFDNLEMTEFPASTGTPSSEKNTPPRGSLDRTVSIRLPQGSGHTISNFIRLAWAIVVSSYTQSKDVVFGLTVLGRGAAVPYIDEMTGPTVATVPFRVGIDGTETVHTALKAIQRHITDLMKYEQTGIQNIRKMSPEAATACDFRSHLGIQPPLAKGENSTASAVQSLLSSATDYTLYASYPLLIVCGLPDENNAMDIQMNYDTSSLSETQASQIMSQFIHVLGQICTQQKISVSEIEIICEEDMSQLSKWNMSLPDYTDSTVHAMVLQHCMNTPTSPALSTSHGTISFAELASLSEILARKLIGFGIQSYSVVALCFEKSIWPVVGMMGVLRAGATCVNIDPTLPASRVKQMLTTTKSDFALTSPSLKQHIEECSPQPIQVLALSNLPDRQHASALNDLPRVPTNHPAFVIFTSGSTGTPKGIIMEHRNLCTSIDHHGPAVFLNQNSRVLHFASYAFDISVYEVFSTLARGGCVCIPTEHERTNDLVGFITRQQINWAVMTPSAVKLLNPTDVPSLQTILLGGESLTYDNVKAWSHRRLVHGYGPAETTICTVGNIKASENWVIGTIGPMLGGIGWVTMPSNPNQLAPLGSVGELLIEGPVVTRGYLNQPELTEKAYILAPSWLQRFRHPAPAGKLYRSGDLVQLTEEGWIRYMGRKDTQVKVRGQRVELGEIEHHLQNRFPGAQEVVAEVIRRGNSALLVAFVCCTQSSSLDDENGFLATPTDDFQALASAACEELKALLPIYMIPAITLPLRRVPLTKTSKTDRKALREEVAQMPIELFSKYEGTTDNPSQGFQRTPFTKLERQLQQIWSIVLNISPDIIGLDDTFHSLGGESISAMQVVARCRSSGLVVTVAQILRSRTIAELAKCVQTVMKTTHVQADDSVGQFQLSPIQKMFFEIVPEGSNHFNQSFLLRLTRPTDSVKMSHAIKAIVEYHAMLRARFSQDQYDQWNQEVSIGDSASSFSFRSHAVDSCIQLDSIILQSQSLLDIKKGPLLVVDMVRIEQEGSEELYLHLVAHHLVIDFVSWRIIFQDLEDLLSVGYITGMKSLSFQKWTQAQADYAANISPQSAIPEYVHEDFNVLQFWGIASSENTYETIRQSSFKLSQQTTSCVLGDANNAFDTQAVEILQAAVLHAFVQTFSDRPAPTMFIEGHGREPWDSSIDLTRTVGWFTTMWPVHIPLTSQDDIMEAIRQTKDSRRRVPANGWQYFASRYSSTDGRAQFHREEPMEILFNYVGLYQQLQRPDSLFQLEQKDQQPDIAGSLRRFALVDVSVSVVESCLTYTFFTNGSMKHQELLFAWVQRCKQSLEEAANNLIALKPQHTLSDFPMLPSLKYEDLDWFTEHTLPDIELSKSEIEDIYPCAPVQKGILLSQAKNPQQYLDIAVWKVSLTTGDPVNIPRLQSAWQQLVDRHAILRTIFLPLSDRNFPDQVVLRTVKADIEICQPSSVAKPRTFSVNKPLHPRHKLFITRESDGSVRMELLISHSLIDGGSNPIIQRDFSLAYAGKMSSSLPSVYRNYISFLQGIQSQLKASNLYWLEYINGLEPCLFPNLRNYSSDNHTAVIDTTKSAVATLNLAEDVQQFCRTQGLTATNIVHLSWALVLQQFTGSSDVCFGYLTSGRDISVDNIEDAVGPFFNILVRRFKIENLSSILSNLSKAQDSLLENLSNQHHPLADLYHDHGLSGQSLFNTLVSVQQFRIDDWDSTLRLEHEGGHDPTEYVLTLSVQLRDDCVRVNIDYDSCFFTESQANIILQSFCKALSSVVGNSSMEIGQVSLLDSVSIGKISQWNGNNIQVEEKCVSQLILRHCQEQPDCPAVCAWDGLLSYRELDELSDGLAIELQSRGVKPNKFVPLCLEKSYRTPVAILATLKAGGAFVLLDVSLPQNRLRSICETLQANVIVSSETTSHLASQLAREVLIIPSKSEILSQRTHGEKSDQPRNSVQLTGPKDAVYAVFTSGSTGTPKGAVIENWSFCTQIFGQREALLLSAKSRILQFSAYTFDVAVLDHLSALTLGGCVCIPSEDQRRNNLAGAVQEQQANWTFLTPSVARSLVPSDFTSLQTICLVGESPRKSDISLWSGVNCIGAYGPAECSMVITVQSPLLLNDPQCVGISQRGRLWVVDPQDYSRLLPIGAIGELLVEAPFVSRGYLGNLDKTKEVFIDPPVWRKHFSTEGTIFRFYKTGDLVQYLENGSIRYIGRKDSQVKLRGQRIELSEIELCVNKCIPSLKSSVASIITLGDGSSPFLAVFLHWNSNDSVEDKDDATLALPPSLRFSQTVSELRQELSNYLPSFMIPSAFIPVSSIPLTSTGKTDLRRLQAEIGTLSRSEIKGYSSLNSATPTLGPYTEKEVILQRLLVDSMSLPNHELSFNDDFFVIGGDSLMAMKLASLASKEGFKLSISDIFQYPVLSDLAKKIQISRKLTGSPPEPFSLLINDALEDVMTMAIDMCCISREEIEDAYPCTPRQEDHIAMAEERPGMHVAQYQFEIPSSLQFAQLSAIWQTVADRNSILRTRIIHTLNGTTMQIVQKAKPIDWHHGNCLKQYLDEDALKPMALGQPMTRFGFIKTPQNSYFVLTFHHVLYDGSTIPLLFQHAEAAHKDQNLQIAPFSEFIRYFVSLDLDAAQKFWTSEFADSQAVSFPRPPNASTSSKIGERITVIKPISIPALAHSSITLVNILQLAWSILVSAYTDSEDVVFRLTTSGRDAPVPNIELMTGPTFAAIPCRIRVLPHQSVEDALLSIQRTASQMVNFRHTGLRNIRSMDPATKNSCNLNTHLLFNVLQDEKPQESGLFRRVVQSDLNVAAFVRDSLHADFNISLANNEVALQVTFDPLALSNDWISRFTSQYEHVFQQVCAGTVQSIGEIQLTCPDSMLQLQKRNNSLTYSGLVPSSDEVRWVTVPSDPSRLAPLGAVGELLIELPILTVTDRNNSVKESDNFIEPPQWLLQFRTPALPGRLYRSGYLARINDASSIELVARKSQKHFGQWVETSNVEHHLRLQLGRGKQVVVEVISLQEHSNSTALVAFVEFNGHPTTSKGDQVQDISDDIFSGLPDNSQFLSQMSTIQTQLREFMPLFMIPDAFIPIRRVPLNLNGEIDRIALLETAIQLKIQEFVPRTHKEPPVSESEVELHRLVAQVLDLPSDQIGIQENFFDLGGDSYTAMLLSTKARFSNLPFTVADIFDRRSLRELAVVGVKARQCKSS